MPAMESGCSFARRRKVLCSKGEQMTWLNESGGEGLLCKWMKYLTSYTLVSIPKRRKRTAEEIRILSLF